FFIFRRLYSLKRFFLHQNSIELCGLKRIILFQRGFEGLKKQLAFYRPEGILHGLNLYIFCCTNEAYIYNL
ncbi:MAG: hypothetical protein PHU88_09135, partial [candidate division Zixibacteria bacterium]|nr:hypothetical protein [candidate division Zixibacteria bacterium]